MSSTEDSNVAFGDAFASEDFNDPFHMLSASSTIRVDDRSIPQLARPSSPQPDILSMLPPLPITFLDHRVSMSMGMGSGTLGQSSTDLSTMLSMQPRSPSYPIALRYIHSFVPLLSLPETASVVTACSSDHGQVHSSLFLNALDALMNIISPAPHTSTVDYFTLAQDQCMPAYFSALSSDPNLGYRGDRPRPCPLFLTAAALIYMMFHQVLKTGWTSSAATYLHLAIDIVEHMPRESALQIGRRRWLARLAWLYDKALTGCGASPSLQGLRSAPASTSAQTEMSQVRQAAPLAALQLDDAMERFSGLVELCLDLETIVDVSKEKDPAWFNNVTLPLCQRVGQWIQSNPWVHASLLRLHSEERVMITDETMVRDAATRVLHLIYYGMSLKFETMDQMRCCIKKTSFFVAVVSVDTIC